MSARCALILFAGLLAGCGDPDAWDGWTEEEWERIASMSPVPPPPPSPTNPVADDEAAAELGRALFFDARLGPTALVSCATCHDPERAHTDGLTQAEGLLRTSRNTPTLRGAAWMRWQTWDGRTDSVWAQSLAVLESEAEHGSTRVRVVRAVARHHAEAYERVFGPLPEPADLARLPPDARPVGDDPDHPHAVAWRSMSPGDRARIDAIFVDVGHALEAFVRRLSPGRSAFDAYVESARRSAGEPTLSAAALRGLRAFVGEAGCFACHHGPLLTDGEFHNIGAPPAIGVPDDDRGRAHGATRVLASEHRCGGPHAPDGECPELRFLDPDHPDFVGAFRTPSLRNVARTGPYMHGGQAATLQEVVETYRTLRHAPRAGHRAPLLRPLPRSVRTADLIAFLEALNGESPEPRWPPI